MTETTNGKIKPKIRDLNAAVYYLSVYFDNIRKENLEFVGIKYMTPNKFLPDFVAKRLLTAKPGCATRILESKRVQNLNRIYNRDFTRIMQYHENGIMPPGILIDGRFGDGQGRACFHYAMGLKMMPVAVFRTKGR